ncbi:MAG TPA: ABC transporter permease [Acidimicrobiales bacterium]|nr:ABC transporter permease [Acidimicrobiales bacterium]
MAEPTNGPATAVAARRGAPGNGSAAGTDVDRELSGLDALELALPPAPSAARRIFDGAWPKVAAIVIALLLWQLVAWSGWKPTYLLPGPAKAFRALWNARSALLSGAGTTLTHGVEFYLIALALGTVIAVVITQSRVVRTAVAPILSGLQTMPSVAWVPFAILLFGVGTARPIMFVAILGATPAIAIGTISGIDAVPPSLLRVGRILGTRGIGHYRYVVLPAALPGYVAGMKQGWAFLWRSLMAGELIAQVPGHADLGMLLSQYQDLSRSADVIATMLIILAIGLIMDTVVFSRLEQSVLRRRGLTTD